MSTEFDATYSLFHPTYLHDKTRSLNLNNRMKPYANKHRVHVHTLIHTRLLQTCPSMNVIAITAHMMPSGVVSAT